MFYRNTNLSNRTNETVGLYCLRSLKQQILQVQRIQPLGVWNLHDKININRVNTLWANTHSSSFDGKVRLCDYVSKLYDSHSHILPSEQFRLFALRAINRDKPLLEGMIIGN